MLCYLARVRSENEVPNESKKMENIFSNNVTQCDTMYTYIKNKPSTYTRSNRTQFGLVSSTISQKSNRDKMEIMNERAIKRTLESPYSVICIALLEMICLHGATRAYSNGLWFGFSLSCRYYFHMQLARLTESFAFAEHDCVYASIKLAKF